MKATICSREKKVFSGSGTKTNFLSELTHQDWKDVHLVGTEVVVQEVSLSSVCHKKAVPGEKRTLNYVWIVLQILDSRYPILIYNYYLYIYTCIFMTILFPSVRHFPQGALRMPESFLRVL